MLFEDDDSLRRSSTNKTLERAKKKNLKTHPWDRNRINLRNMPHS